jgi:hypothetical protein
MDNRTKIEHKLKRSSGMSPGAKARLQEALKDRQWWVRCWNCKETVEGTIAELQGTCPHCGASFRERVNGKSMTGTKLPEGQEGHQNPNPRRHDANGKMIKPKGVPSDATDKS